MSAMEKARRLWFSTKEAAFLRRHGDRSARFESIYANNHWRNAESVSGFGSTLAATEALRDDLSAFIRDRAIKSMIDAPCGDFNWMSQVDLPEHYTGLDIVPALIDSNIAAYGSDHRRFAVADIVDSVPQSAELVVCRECLNHLSLAEAKAALENLTASASRYLMATHFPGTTVNTDQSASFRFRPLNLMLPPFNLPPPVLTIQDSHLEPERRLGVWQPI
jgi:hypothetical protein